ncbi:MAG: hypothetical protein IT349_06585 [Candidatus Eisenbacteria bacterium]|nr:hypothetical protein [Candidatus Eisenbacteria bacterium]
MNTQRPRIEITRQQARGVAATVATSIALLYAAAAAAQEVPGATGLPMPGQETQGQIAQTEQWARSRVFSIPTGRLVRAGDLRLSFGGLYEPEREQSFFGSAGVGLGGVAEVEMASQPVVNGFKRGSFNFATSAFKMQLLKETEGHPAFSWTLRGTPGWHTTDREPNGSSFRFRMVRLYASMSREIRDLDTHFGVSVADVRVKDMKGWENAPQGDLQKNLFAPFAAVTYRSNPQARVLAEVEAIPRFEFDPNRRPSKKDIGLVWVGMVGVRYSLSPSVALDSGVSYRSDYRGLADASIHGGLNVLFPLRNLKSQPARK